MLSRNNCLKPKNKQKCLTLAAEKGVLLLPWQYICMYQQHLDLSGVLLNMLAKLAGIVLIVLIAVCTSVWTHLITLIWDLNPVVC